MQCITPTLKHYLFTFILTVRQVNFLTFHLDGGRVNSALSFASLKKNNQPRLSIISHKWLLRFDFFDYIGHKCLMNKPHLWENGVMPHKA